MPTVGVPASAAGVHARKIRLLNAINPKDLPTKAFLETSKAPSKFGKWLSYTSVASYKKHNKINFKYVVLRHTDMPLDPGDSITQRDIGYAGVLDKVNLTENAEDNEETTSSPDETADKEKTKIPAVSPKPPNQITLHRKVVSKLKAKEKTTEKENTEDDTENTSHKNTDAKLQNTSEAQSIVTQVSIDAKQNEVQKSYTDLDVQLSKNLQGEVIEVRSVLEIIKAKPENITKDVAPKNQEKVSTFKKTTALEDVKNIPNLESSQPEDKATTSRKQTNPENTENYSTDKNNSTKMSEEPMKPKNLNSDKAKSTKKPLNKAKNLSALKQSSVVKTKQETKSNVITDSMIFVLADAIKKKTASESSKTHFGTEGVKGSNHSIKNKNGSKINYVRTRLGSVKRNKSTKSVEKVLIDKSRTESVNVLRISKKEREEHLKRKLAINVANVNKKMPYHSRAFNGRDNTSKSQNNSAKRIKTELAAKKRSKSKNGPAKKNKKQESVSKEPRAGPPKDSTKTTSSISHKKSERKIFGVVKVPKERDSDRKVSKTDMKNNDSDEIILQPSLNTQELIFMMSDSDSSFKTALSLSDDETMSYEDSDSCEGQTSFDHMSSSPSSKYLFKEERINTNSIKRYTKRNKYCE